MSTGKTNESPALERDMIKRGVKQRNLLGTATFVLSRAADPFLQYGILSNGLGAGLIERLRGTVLPKGPPLVTNTFLDSYVGLSPYRSILFAMAVGSMVKQNFHVTAIMQEEMPPLNGMYTHGYEWRW